jgi:hypothetical protein
VSEGNGKITQKQRKLSERSLANLKPFPPGVSGNPGGKPKGPTLLGEIHAELDARGGKRRKKSASAFVDQMERGSLAHAKEVIEREEGAVPNDGRMRVEVVFVDERPDGTDDPSPN